MRLKTTEVRAYRKKLLKTQGGVCALCHTDIKPANDTLDHCHVTGHVRRVLCRNCNQVEGRVLSWIRKVYCTPQEFIANLAMYWADDYTRNPFHPNHLSDTEKHISKLRKRMKKLKTERGRQKYRDKINELKETL